MDQRRHHASRVQTLVLGRQVLVRGKIDLMAGPLDVLFFEHQPDPL